MSLGSLILALLLCLALDRSIGPLILVNFLGLHCFHDLYNESRSGVREVVFLARESFELDLRGGGVSALLALLIRLLCGSFGGAQVAWWK